MRESLWLAISSKLDDICWIGQGEDLLPNTLCLYAKDTNADDLVIAMDMEGVSISSGAACSSGKPDPSHVLLAMGLSEKEARSTVRFSLGSDVDCSDIEKAAAVYVKAVQRMRDSR